MAAKAAVVGKDQCLPALFLDLENETVPNPFNYPFSC